MHPKIYKMMSDDIPQKYIAVYNWRERKTNRFDFMDCKELPENEEYDLIMDVRGPMRLARRFGYLGTTFSSPLINEKALKVLQELCPNDFQVFPAKVQAIDGVMTEYSILNLLYEIDHVNYDLSEARYFEDGAIQWFEHLVMHPGALKGHHIGRLKDVETSILVSEEFVKAFEKSHIKGARFRPIETAGKRIFYKR